MKKILKKLRPFSIFIPLVIMIVSFVFLSSRLSDKKELNTDIRSKAAGNTLTVCPDATGGCTYAGGEGLQKAVDDAKDGDVIQISGTITNRNPTVDTKIKFERCMVNLRGKNITLKGPAKLYGENGSYKTPDWDMVIGVCSEGGNITVDGIQVMQTLRHGFYFQRSNVNLINVSTNDIDNVSAEFIGGNVSVSNSIFGGGASVVSRGGANIRLINNTISTGGTGFSIDLCTGEPTAYIVNNIIKLAQPGYNTENPDPNGIGIAVKCPEKLKSNPNSKIAYNMVWKGANGAGGPPGCAAGEYCEGVIFADPKIINTTIYGDIGWSYAINWDLEPDSPAQTAGDGGVKIGGTGNACSAPNSDACKTLNSPIAVEEPTAAPPPPAEEYPTQIPTNENPNLPPDQPAHPPSSENKPPITYYLPPTMSFTNPNQQPGNTQTEKENPPAPTITPTPKPLIDMKKTVENAKNSMNNLWNSFINFTKTILP